MKKLFILLVSFSAIMGNAQETQKPKAENGIYVSAKLYKEGNIFLHFYNSSQSTRFREPIGHSNEIWIKTEDSTYKFYFEDIWGYRREGKDWRIFNNNVYQIEDTLQICIYTMPTFITYTPGVANFFSKDVESPIYPLDRKELIAIYHSNQKFVNYIKNLPWYESIMKWDKNKHQFVFINWLQ